MLALVFVAMVTALTVHVTASSMRVSGSSMSPFAVEGDILLVNRVSGIARGDVVIAAVPAGWAAESPERVVKRVIGVGGDRVSCCDGDTGALVLNGVPLAEPYLDGVPASSVGFDVRVPDAHVWLLGDNRPTSLDSREHLSEPLGGAVPDSRVVGVVWASLPP